MIRCFRCGEEDNFIETDFGRECGHCGELNTCFSESEAYDFINELFISSVINEETLREIREEQDDG